MDFNQLMAKMRELDVAEEIKDETVDAPVEETSEEIAEPSIEETTEETEEEAVEEEIAEEPVEEETVDECPTEMEMGPEMGHDEPKPTMNVTMTAQGVDEIGELMKLFTKVNPDMINQPEKPMDMPKIVKLPLDLDNEKSDDKEEAYSNEPDEVKHSDNVHNGDDLNKKKGTYPKVAGGDNPMQDMRESIKAELQARLAELKGAK